MVPVIDKNKHPLMPCSEKRARKLMEKQKQCGRIKLTINKWRTQLLPVLKDWVSLRRKR